MTVGPVRKRSHVAVRPAAAPTHLARWAVGLAAFAAGAVVVGLGLFGIAVAVGGTDATADNWVGVLVVDLMFSGFLASLVAFGIAVTARVRHQRWAWLPLAVFPALVAVVVLGEAFWWE